MFKRWLQHDVTVDTGPAFEWIADDGVWRGGPDFPLAPAGTLDSTGQGLLTITPADYANAGLLTFAAPALNAIAARFATPPSGSDVLGEPRVRLERRPVRGRTATGQQSGGRVHQRPCADAAPGDALRPTPSSSTMASGCESRSSVAR